MSFRRRLQIGLDRRTFQLAPFLTVLLATGTFALGFSGFKSLDKPVGTEVGTADAFYMTLQLFALEWPEGVSSRGVPLRLDAARLLAPLVVALAGILAFLAVFREQARLFTIRAFGSSHVVVAGVGDKGFRLATALQDAGLRVVVIELNAANGLLQGCAKRGIAVVRGDARDSRLLRGVRVGDARYLLVTCGDDSTNLDVAIAARNLVPSRRQGVLSAFVHLDDIGLWRLLRVEAVGMRRGVPFRLEFFNVFELGALMLLEHWPPFGQRANGTPHHPHVLVVGADRIGESVVLHVASLWRNLQRASHDVLRITLLGPAALEQRDSLLERYPGLGQICELDAGDIVRWSVGGGPAATSDDFTVTAAYVCLPRETESLAAAISLWPGLRANVPLVVAVQDDEGGVASVLRYGGDRFAPVSEFATLTRTLSPEVVLRGTNEIVARALHENYVWEERAKGVSEAANPSVVRWDDLPESLKDSNRMASDEIVNKLTAAGCVVLPAPLVTGAALPLSPDEVEDLARMEHKRWMDDLLREDWRHGPAPDAERRRHPYLVPWEELPEEEREKDRGQIRGLPKALARAGFEIRRISMEPKATPPVSTTRRS